MSDNPSTSGPPPIQPTSSRTVRRRRPTALPADDAPRNEVRILRPSEVPQREPMPEYKPIEFNRIIVPKDVPIERLIDYHNADNTRNVVIPTFVSSEELRVEAEKTNETISFRSTNFVDPDIIWKEILKEKKEEEEGKEEEDSKYSDVEVYESGSESDAKSEIEAIVDEDERVDEEMLDARQEFIQKSMKLVGGTYGLFTTRLEKNEISNTIYTVFKGPKGTPYEGGTYFLRINFNLHPDFFYVVPIIRFVTMMFHPNISKYGQYDVRNLMETTWNKHSTLVHLYRWLESEMVNLKDNMARKTVTELNEMSQPNIAHLAAGDWATFERLAVAMTKKMAGGSLAESVVAPTNTSGKFSEGNASDLLGEDEIDVVG